VVGGYTLLEQIGAGNFCSGECITRTAHSEALIVKGTGYDVDTPQASGWRRSRPTMRQSTGRTARTTGARLAWPSKSSTETRTAATHT
jgi:hypothetical protein